VEVALLGRPAPQLDPASLARRDERDREVPVDVRIHPCERELEGQHAHLAARLEQRRPRLRNGPGLEQ
jgi:hypothetical protein